MKANTLNTLCLVFFSFERECTRIVNEFWPSDQVYVSLYACKLLLNQPYCTFSMSWGFVFSQLDMLKAPQGKCPGSILTWCSNYLYRLFSMHPQSHSFTLYTMSVAMGDGRNVDREICPTAQLPLCHNSNNSNSNATTVVESRCCNNSSVHIMIHSSFNGEPHPKILEFLQLIIKL